jgi:signal transduction histidine kinase
MLNKLNHTQLLRYAGLFTWAMVGIPLVLNSWYFPVAEVEETLLSKPDMVGSTVAYFAFGLAYWLVTHDLGARKPRWYDIALLAVMTVTAIAVSQLTGTGLGAILLMIVAGVIPWLMPVSAGVAWMIVQHMALVPVFIKGQGFTPIAAVLQTALFIGYSSFTFVTGFVAKQQAQAREDQRRLNAELRATRVLLAESSRMSERLRISRELHDLLGHHLTALSLNLEVAGHLTEGKAHDHVKQSHTLAKLLLTDVREAVSEMREDGGIDVTTAFQSLVDGVTALKIHLELPEVLQLDDPDRAHVLLRCAQEIITNTVRHSGADELWLRLSKMPDYIELFAKDNGRSLSLLTQGNGLRGMSERLAEFGGQLDIMNTAGQGLSLTAKLPLRTLVKEIS